MDQPTEEHICLFLGGQGSEQKQQDRNIQCKAEINTSQPCSDCCIPLEASLMEWGLLALLTVGFLR